MANAAHRARWFNSVADAFAAGEAPWAYPGGRSLMVTTWTSAYATSGREEEADQAAIRLAAERGITTRRRNPLRTKAAPQGGRER